MNQLNKRRVQSYCILLFCVVTVFFIGFLCKKYNEHTDKTEKELNSYKTVIDDKNREMESLRKSVDEFEIENKRLKHLASQQSETHVVFKTRLQRDTVICTVTEYFTDTVYLQTFHWQDPWTQVSGEIYKDSIMCQVMARDTVYTAIERIPRRFLGIPFGTKSLKQHIKNTNPHTQLYHEEYVVE